MYSKCGCFRDADKLFQRMEMRDVFSWTAMITCYAHQGMASKSLALFESMKAENVHPYSVTFLGILTACTHAGLVEEGKYYFNSMNSDYDVKPNLEHHACMVDMFGRSGQLERAVHLIQTGQMWFKEHESGSCLCLWKVSLGACHMHKRLDLGVHSATKILDMDPNDETTHVLLSNLYSFGLWEDAIRIMKSMKDKGLKKEAGISWIEVERERHVFVAGDVCHPSRGEIYEKLEELENKCRHIGYVPMTEYVIHDVDELQKEDIIRCHSDKLAVSFGLIRGKATRVISVIKNLRVCRDCHNWMKLISLVEDREIVLRDSRRFHCFKDGKCSCGDYL
ncbi:Pentatricopeptide repeat-containing protein [Acorus calamus]|uniref:Pentatricopeptide repeat-containing protein n=1 Tax=Acorus calamus TaxID=4465 RepID=A0AAV9CZE9_ACOCL|nr:Pentatricopeptide repeat-containing protein [Acorus calamus]